MKEQQDHDITTSRFSNDRNRYYYSAKILLINKYDCHSLFMQLQILASISRKEACQDVLSNQQENTLSQLEYKLYSRESDSAYHAK